MLYSADDDIQTYEANTGAAPAGNDMLYSADGEDLDQTYEVTTGVAPTNGGMLMYSADFGGAALKAAPAGQASSELYTDAEAAKSQTGVFVLQGAHTAGAVTDMGETTTEAMYSDEGMQADGKGTQPGRAPSTAHPVCSYRLYPCAG